MGDMVLTTIAVKNIRGRTMTKYLFAQLTQTNALEIANNWHYPDEYAFYDMSADPEDYEELINPQQRGDQYYQATDSNGTLLGFFALMNTDDPATIELGLGLAPQMTGRGSGAEFLRQILAYMEEHVTVEKVILDVAEFNVRAQKVYARLGFVVGGKHDQATNGGVWKFVTMTRNLVE